MRGGGFSSDLKTMCLCVCVCFFFSVSGCVCVAACALPGRGAGGNVRYEIRMQYKERDASKLN